MSSQSFSNGDSLKRKLSSVSIFWETEITLELNLLIPHVPKFRNDANMLFISDYSVIVVVRGSILLTLI